MRIKTSRSSNGSESYSVIKDVKKNGKRTTVIVESLGNKDYISSLHPGVDPLEWAKNYAKELTMKEKENSKIIIEKYRTNKTIKKGEISKFNCGYLFLQSIYHQLKLVELCKKISSKYNFKYNLSEILSTLCYQRILDPGSKFRDYRRVSRLLEEKNKKFDLHHIYRALGVIQKETDTIQDHVYKTSLDVVDRNTRILYYDCTNFYFEIAEAEDEKQYGKSKENRPNPIIQMGLFMDGSGLPLAFETFDGNKNEQTSMKPIEEKIIKDFKLSEFVVCTDAGLSSISNRKFNNVGNRYFVTTQSIKKLKGHLKEWCLNKENWKYQENGVEKIINLDQICLQNNNNIYYKERWINENGLEQKLFVSFSPKHKLYQSSIRDKQVERARKKIKTPSKLKKKSPNDANRFIKTINTTKDGEKAKITTYEIDQSIIDKESIYDGFYGICTNLDCTASEIIRINSRRWEIEETFRIMKSEFEARPVYLKRNDRIKAHFTTCFLSLLIFRILEKKIGNEFTYPTIIEKLQEMEVTLHNEGIGYKPAYVRDDLTDKLHDIFGFRTDYEIVLNEEMKKIFKQTRSCK